MARPNVRRLIQRLGPVSRATLVRLVAIAGALPAAAALCPTWAGAVEAVPIMYLDPLLPKAAFEERFPPELAGLWIEALKRPERELKRQAASAIASAHRQGLTGLEGAIDPLMKLLQQPDQDRFTRLTVSRTLGVLDARQAAELLSAQLRPDDLDMAELVEPVLARWQYAPLREVWMKRLANEVTLRRMHILAIRGLAALQATEALPRLLELAQDGTVSADVRLEAATALGQVQEAGLLEPARRMAGNKSPEAVVERILAARMLARHGGPETQTLLVELATDAQPAVSAIALGHLFRIDPDLILPVIDQTITSEDATVRRWGAKVLVAKPTLPKLALLAPMLHDADPELRSFVCDALLELSQDPALHDAIVQHGRQILVSDGWRGQEQAILLLVTLDDKSIVDQLLELLAATRPEVHATAAWGLCQLQVPATAERILDIYTKATDVFMAPGPKRAGMYAQLSYLAQALGRLNVAAADGVLRKYVPKNLSVHPTSRAAAIWALGLLHAEQPDEKLADQFLERLLDIFNPMIPEEPEVARMSAVSLGRMKSAHTLTELRKMRDGCTTQSAIGLACAWAVCQITGEAMEDIEPMVKILNDWFLTPTAPLPSNVSQPPAPDGDQ
ncbi:MAG: HEAT repeat domain-containing protein [Pirellulaceae bacterium]